LVPLLVGFGVWSAEALDEPDGVFLPPPVGFLAIVPVGWVVVGTVTVGKVTELTLEESPPSPPQLLTETTTSAAMTQTTPGNAALNALPISSLSRGPGQI
jgi:hypothetical protein